MSTEADSAGKQVAPGFVGQQLSASPQVRGNGKLQSAPIETSGMTGLNLFHLELLHHFCTVTYQTLATDPLSLEIWQNTIVKYGLRFPFLMFELLAISALHMGHLSPEKQDFYFQEAIELQSRGLNGFNAFQRDIDRTSAGAILIFSSLISLHVFADPLNIKEASLEGYLQHFLQSVRLMQSVRGLVIHDWWAHLSKSELKGLFAVPRVSEPYEIPEQCRNLENVIRNSTPDAKAACRPAIERLQWLYAVSEVPKQEHCKVRWLLAWPAQLDIPYLAELDRRTPEAFVILAYYATFMHFYRASWVVRNSGRELIEAIGSLIGEEWRDWLKWPREVTGL